MSFSRSYLSPRDPASYRGVSPASQGKVSNKIDAGENDETKINNSSISFFYIKSLLDKCGISKKGFIAPLSLGKVTRKVIGSYGGLVSFIATILFNVLWVKYDVLSPVLSEKSFIALIFFGYMGSVITIMFQCARGMSDDYGETKLEPMEFRRYIFNFFGLKIGKKYSEQLEGLHHLFKSAEEFSDGVQRTLDPYPSRGSYNYIARETSRTCNDFRLLSPSSLDYQKDVEEKFESLIKGLRKLYEELRVHVGKEDKNVQFSNFEKDFNVKRMEMLRKLGEMKG